MFNWLKKVFRDFTKDTAEDPLVMKVSEFVFPPVDCNVPMPKVKSPAPEKDISEPVLAIVECMKKYPSRWKYKEVWRPVKGQIYTQKFTVVQDIRTNEEWRIGRLHRQTVRLSKDNYAIEEPWVILGQDWLTKDEKQALVGTFKSINAKKEARMKSFKKVKENNERNRLKEVYK